jgi:YggT family protein
VDVFLDYLRRFLELLLQALTFCILIRAIMSWITPGQTNPITKVLFQITEPVLAPLRKILPQSGVVDLSPMVAVIILQLIIFLVLPLIG